MLERATGYIETAGRRFLRDPSGAIQARRCLSQHFWKHNIGGDAGHLLSALTQQPDQSSSLVQRSSRRNQSSNDANLPFLDFLYPLRAQELTTLRLSRLPKRVGFRRRKRTPTGLRRTYVSEALPASQSQNAGQQDVAPQKDTQLDNIPVEDDTNETVRPVQAINKLWKHLKAPVKNSDSYEIAWVIFLSAGRPPEALSEACAYFSRSNKPVNQDRAWEIFSEMKDPSGDDFHNITHSQFQRNPKKLMQICHLALKFKRSRSTFALCFIHFMNNREWKLAEKVWILRSKFNDKEKGEIIPATWNLGISPETILELMTSLEGDVETRSRNLSKIAEFLLGRFSTSLWMLKDPPMETVSAILEKSYSLGFLTLRHYDNIIRTLQSATVKADFTRSIICYRQMRLHFSKKLKKCSFLPRQLELVVQFQMSSHVDYFLDEIAHFFGKPSLQHYRTVLNLFGRSGDVSKVHSVFDRLLADHGNPKSRKLVAPVLLAHAEIGDVPGALAQFQRMQTEFRLEPNTVCWNIVLTAYVNANDLEGVSTQFSKMAQAGVKPDSHTFGILMGICANRGDVPGVRRLLQQAEERRVPITIVMLGTVAQAYISSGRVDLAEQLANQCLNMKLDGSPMRTWNSILMQYAFRIDHGAFKRVSQRMEEAGLKPDAMTHAADLLRLALIGSAEKARMTLRRLHKEGSVHATEVHYAIVLLAYVKQRNLPMALQILQEAVARFPESGLAMTLKNFEAEIAPDLDMAKENGLDLTAEERLKRVEILLIESIANRNITALASTLSSDAPKNGVASSFTSWSHEYLIRQYGANGAIELARGLFDKHLVDRQADSHSNGQSTPPAPLRLINSIMTANLSAGQFKEVDECWKLALESGIKEASRLHVDEQVEQHLKLEKSSTEPPSPNPAEPTKIEIIPARRFALSQPLSIYMRSLSARNEPERIADVVAEVEEIGFELSTFNWTIFVRMLSESDNFELVSEAFRVHEKRFMPNWPGWNRLKNGQLFKPSGTPRGTYLLENPNAPEQSKHYLGREAGKYWSNVAPEFLQPSYLTVVYLSAALERMRNLSVVRGGTELDQLFHLAPQTLEAISKMPYLRDKFQGTMVRERSEAPEKEPQPLLDVKVARGGILGPGVKPRRLHAVNPAEFDESVDAQEEAAEQPSGEPISDPKQAGESVEAPKKKEKKAPAKPRIDPHQLAANAMAEQWQDILTPEELSDFQAQSRYNRTRPRPEPHKPVKPKKPETAPKYWKTPPGTKSPTGRETPKGEGSQRRHKKF